MNEKPDYNSKDLRLHRKYILVVCLILIFLKFGEVKLEKINFLGNEVNNYNHSALYLVIWIVLAYSIIRYIGYLIHESWGHVQTEFSIYKDQYYQKAFTKIVRKKLKPEAISLSTHYNADRLAMDIHYRNAKKLSGLGYVLEKPIILENPEDGSSRQTNFHITFTPIKLFKLAYIKTIFHYIFLSPHFFEFIFPLLLALFTIIYCHFGCWEGSLTNILTE